MGTTEPERADELVERMRRLCRPIAPLPTAVEPKLVRLAGIRAVLFDVYGTLLASPAGDVGTAGGDAGTAAEGDAAAPSLAIALAASLRETGFAGDLSAAAEAGVRLFEAVIRSEHEERRRGGCDHPEVDVLRIWRAVLADLRRERLLEPRAGEDPVQELAVEYECRVNAAWPMPGLEDLLAALVRKRLVLGIVSNAQFYTPLLLRCLLGRPILEAGFEPAACAWSYTVGEAKPSPALFRGPIDALARRPGIAPHEVLYAGNDMLNDILPAARLGLATALFAGDRRSYRPRAGDPRCSGLEPDLVVTSLAQIEEVV